MSVFCGKWNAVCRCALIATLAGLFPVAPVLGAEGADKSTTATVMLQSKVPPGGTANVEVTLQVGGEILLNAGGTGSVENKLKRLPMSVAAKLQYEEQLLTARETFAGTARTGRRYQQARALIEIDQSKQEAALAGEHVLISAERTGSEIALFSPGKRLSRDELDLIDVAANPATLDDLLPNRQVAIGESWPNNADQLAALLRLDAVSLAEVNSLLAEYDAATGQATISLAGTVHGAVGGVATEIEIKSKYVFSTSAQRVVRFALLFKEKRSVGHVGPGLDVVVKQLVVVKPLASAQLLTADDLKALASPADESARRLVLDSPQNGFRIEHNRNWFITSDDRKLTVLRYIDRGELVGQCNLTPLDPITASKNDLTLAGFQSDIEKSLGERFGQFVSAKETTDSQNRRVYRVVTHGKVADLPIQWVYYLLTTADGRRLSVAFTMEQSLVERFGNADELLVKGIELTTPVVESAKSETPKQR